MNGLTHDPSSPMLSEEDDYEEDDEFWNRAKYEQDDFFNYLNFDDTSSKLDDESAKLLSQIEEEGELPDEEEVEEDIEFF
ncbi:hypothetical protein QCA50_012192 [Cerrena zonata]|uniref:Uncharacterized protein n=1 Tax=Cerrena zonata TaxID=2478898 RepID=A0AAW0FUS4_9APHY